MQSRVEDPMFEPTDRAVTIFDVARLAGVSKSTASRVLTGASRVSAAAVEQVNRAAAELAYVRNPAALSLANHSGTRVVIGVVSPRRTLVVDEYLGRVVSSAAKVCAVERVGVGLQPLWLNDRDPLAALTNDPTVHGVVLVNTTHSLLEAVSGRLVGRVASIGVGSDVVPSVDVDCAAAARASTRHLVESGRRRIAMVTGPKWLPCIGNSVQAYIQTMRDAGFEPRTVVGDFTAFSGQVAAAEVLRRWPDVDAVIAICDATAIGVMAELRARHIDVPGDVAVAGFDDIPYAQFTQLTTATHPVEAIAEAATRAVLGGATSGAPDIKFPSELVLRQTA
jgi:DNA-binding LacI/PurR family transcriptional regulator